MKKGLLSLTSIMLATLGYSQWKYERVNNGFDDPYRIAYTSPNNNAILKLEKVGDAVAFYITGTYYCEDEPIVDLVFIVNGEERKYYAEASTSDSRQTVFILDDILTSNVLESFKACSKLRVRVNESYCDTEVYSFNMSGSSAALNFVKSE